MVTVELPCMHGILEYKEIVLQVFMQNNSTGLCSKIRQGDFDLHGVEKNLKKYTVWRSLTS